MSRHTLNLTANERGMLVYVCGYYLGARRNTPRPPSHIREWVKLLGKLGVENPQQYFPEVGHE